MIKHAPFIIILIALLASLSASTTEAMQKKSTLTPLYPTKVVVFDGDTLLIKQRGKRPLTFRLFGIDAPEVAHQASHKRPASKGQAWGEEAKKALFSFINNKQLSYILIAHDQYKRKVVILFADERNVNLELLQEGDAWAYRHYLKGKPEKKAFIHAEQQAKRTGKGLWRRTAPPPQPPWAFRHQRNRTGRKMR